MVRSVLELGDRHTSDVEIRLAIRASWTVVISAVVSTSTVTSLRGPLPCAAGSSKLSITYAARSSLMVAGPPQGIFDTSYAGCNPATLAPILESTGSE